MTDYFRFCSTLPNLKIQNFYIQKETRGWLILVVNKITIILNYFISEFSILMISGGVPIKFHLLEMWGNL